MKSKKLTKEQILELENEAYGLLQGQSHYTKKTAAEPTEEQFQKIFLRFELVFMNKRRMGDETWRCFVETI